MEDRAETLRGKHGRLTWRGAFRLAALLPLALVLERALEPGTIPFGHPSQPYYTDMVAFHVPLRAFYAERLGEGEFPLWLPQLFCGWDMAGEGQIGAFHPLHIVTHGLLGWQWGMKIDVAFAYALCFAGMFLFLRGFIGAEGSLLGATAFTFGGSFAWRVIHLNMFLTLAHMPIGMWCVCGIARGDRAALRAALLGLTLGSQILFGFPQAVWFSVLCWAGLTLALGGMRLRPWGWLTAGIALGGLIGAVQLSASFVYFLHSDRGTRPAAFLLSYWLHPLRLTSLLYPLGFYPGFDCARVSESGAYEPNPAEYGIFVGTSVLLLAIAGMMNGKREDRLWRFAVGVIVFGLLMGLGRWFPPYRLMLHVPIIGKFRAPVRYSVFISLGLCILAACAIGRAGKDGLRGGRLGLLPASFVALSLASLLALAVFLNAAGGGVRGSLTDFHGWMVWQLPFPALAFISACLFHMLHSETGGRRAMLGIMVVSSLELSYLAIAFPGGRSITREGFQKVIEAGPELHAGRPPFRLACGAEANTLLLKGVWLTGGYAGAFPERPPYDPRSEFGMRISSADASLDFDKESGDVIFQQINDPIPRAYVLPVEAVTSSGPWRRNHPSPIPLIDPRRQAIVFKEGPSDTAIAPPASGADLGDSKIIEDRCHLVRVRVNAKKPSCLILNDRFYPGWRATVGGRDTEILRANGIFRAVVVPEGESEVVFTYSPRWIIWGAVISACGLVISLALAALSLTMGAHRVRSHTLNL
ncbi:MAG TPA: YfhO family protein [Candidatus Brocadiia bacterium]|nr:YfhO family protein [Candidatus Brocadiia bacterium]